MKTFNVGILGCGNKALGAALALSNRSIVVKALASALEAVGCQIVLLSGLNDATPTLAALQRHASLRAALSEAGIGYHVLYGTDCERQQQAQRTIDRGQAAASAVNGEKSDYETWHWSCESCGDSVCEHRLFSSLLAHRQSD